eukprot:gb/GECG01010473.1/.p1 GENE.gb/GECG01010473.1/~~gb/GECG01010473.1/.p1  ORF type:complete len:243 (+),score=40.72 gb/GECG01010473.1/:1-729(+)
MLSNIIRANRLLVTPTRGALSQFAFPVSNVATRTFASDSNNKEVDVSRKTPKRRGHRKENDIDLADPFNAVDHIRQLQDRFFDQAFRNTPFGNLRSMFSDPFSMLSHRGREGNDELGFPEFGPLANWSPQLALDVKEHDDHFEITVDTPGLDKDNVKVEVEDDVLHISAETGDKKEKTEKDNEGNVIFHRYERQSGSASRAIRLPDTANPEEITANMDKGVLTLHVPKYEPSKKNRRHVEIK